MNSRERWLLGVVVALVVLVLGLLALDAWGLQLFHGSGIDYTRFGTWSDFVAGVFTTAAVLVALGAVLNDQRTRDADARKQTDAEQTSLFSWLESEEILEQGSRKVLRINWDVQVRNTTGSPVYDWVLIVGPEHRCRHSHGALIPGDRLFNMPELDGAAIVDVPEPMLTFRDRDGRVWTRSARGVLVQQKTDDGLSCLHNSAEEAS